MDMEILPIKLNYKILKQPFVGKVENIGHRLSWILLSMVLWYSFLSIIDGAKNLNFVDNGPNKYRFINT